MTAETLAHITVDSQVCHGQACLKGTRIPVSVVLHCVGDGTTVEEIVAQYPSLTPQAIRAASYGAALAREEVLPLAGDR